MSRYENELGGGKIGDPDPWTSPPDGCVVVPVESMPSVHTSTGGGTAGSGDGGTVKGIESTSDSSLWGVLNEPAAANVVSLLGIALAVIAWALAHKTKGGLLKAGATSVTFSKQPTLRRVISGGADTGGGLSLSPIDTTLKGGTDASVTAMSSKTPPGTPSAAGAQCCVCMGVFAEIGRTPHNCGHPGCNAVFCKKCGYTSHRWGSCPVANSGCRCPLHLPEKAVKRYKKTLFAPTFKFRKKKQQGTPVLARSSSDSSSGSTERTDTAHPSPPTAD